MSFKKLNPELLAVMTEKGIQTPNDFQANFFPLMKQGVDLFGIGPKGCGKRTALILTVLHKLQFKAEEDAPRAIILVKDKAEALALEEAFLSYIKYKTDLRVYAAYEEKMIEHQKDEIYFGVDILISTVKRFSKLYFLNCINVNLCQTFCVYKADFIIRKDFHTDIVRISESLTKCQHIVFAESFHPKLEILHELIMPKARIVKG
ncbi:MAG: DEAD/DEAH box helicase [Putridiphycobacter sp.]|nr:DEAD/DEAH box helicase [Putridiphycobacter sp.]